MTKFLSASPHITPPLFHHGSYPAAPRPQVRAVSNEHPTHTFIFFHRAIFCFRSSFEYNPILVVSQFTWRNITRVETNTSLQNTESDTASAGSPPQDEHKRRIFHLH